MLSGFLKTLKTLLRVRRYMKRAVQNVPIIAGVHALPCLHDPGAAQLYRRVVDLTSRIKSIIARANRLNRFTMKRLSSQHDEETALNTSYQRNCQRHPAERYLTPRFECMKA